MAESSNTLLRRQLLQTLESFHAAGVQQITHCDLTGADSLHALSAGQAISDGPPGQSHAATPAPDGAVGMAAAPPVALDVLAAEVAACRRCDELATTRTQTVFGVGNPQARLCFLGEAPGADEDRIGEPFVGSGGQLLDKILAACHLRREDVYILNVLKCRPPNNRNPTPTEAQNCRHFLDRQLQSIQPEFICCLGAVASQNLLNTTRPIGELRGRVHQVQDIRVVCTYHPAYLLRTPAAKRRTWDDMKLLMREMGTPVT